MSPETEPTPWELMRLLRKIDDRLEHMETRMVSGEVFRAHQEAIERRFNEAEADQRDWTVESRGEHVRLDAKVDTLRVDLTAQLDGYKAAQDAVVREQRAARGRVWLAVGVAVLSGLVSLGVGVLLQGIGGG